MTGTGDPLGRGRFVEEIYTEEAVTEDGKTESEEAMASSRMLGLGCLASLLAFMAAGAWIAWLAFLR